MIKLSAVVILYYPEKVTVQNILSYSNFVERIYAIDNSETPSEEFKKEINKVKNCTYFQKNKNEGISKRLNEAFELARSEGYEWILAMDQDSSFSEGTFKRYLDYVEAYPKNDVAIFGVNYLPKFWPQTEKPTEILSTITSGSIINLLLNKVIGKHNEDLFIDLVDAEYSYRAIALGYKIIFFSDIVLNHTIGYIQYGRSLKNFKLTPRILHNPVRIYYIVRNSLYMLNKFPHLPDQGRKEIKQCLSLLKNNILYHKQRGLVLKNIIRGYLDYKKNRMGKF